MTRHRRWWLGAAVVCALALLGLAFVVQGSYAQDLPPAPGAPLEDEGLLEAPLSSAHFQLSWNRIATEHDQTVAMGGLLLTHKAGLRP